MDKEASIKKITGAYGKYIGRKPWIEGPVLGTLGGLAGYFGGGLVLPTLTKALMTGRSDQEVQDALRELKRDPGTQNMLRSLLASMGVAGGLGYAAQKHLDFGAGAEGLGRSFIEGQDYWNRPEVQDHLERIRKQQRKDISYRPIRTYSSGRTMKKTAGEEYSNGLPANFEYERVPLSQAMDLINEDPFLTLPQKEITDVVFQGAEGKSTGLVSGKDLMRSAVRLGVGATTGYLFGRAASSLLSLPTTVTKRLSQVGAVAGGLINTGIFSELL
jgi:hypothetical protein